MAGWSWLDGRERTVLERLAELRGTPFDDAMRFVSTGPPRLAVWALATAFACWRTRSARPLLAVATAFALAQLVVGQLQSLFGRERPPLTSPAIHALATLPGSGSFPSGHATGAAAVAAALWWSARPVSLALGGFAVVVAFSRLWLAVHYPSDVVAGLALGAAVGLACGLATRTGSEPLRALRSRWRPPRPP